ncbi:MAG TPA: CopG family transcriptional regulator [Gammaproteobacteria bacterium]|nr:CopG family transcriptional regulator [Gammaproteobacteria bacterium]
MGQVTIYLNDEDESRLRKAAEESGVPVSRWVARLVEERTRDEWPDSVRQLAGQWSDFPETEELRDSQVADAERESL